MTRELWLALLIPAAYVAGSIPFGLLVGLAKGVDPRKAGSGNIGATNVARLLGGRFFAIVFSLDLLKGLLPMLAAAAVIARHGGQPGAATYALWLTIGAAAIVGHMFSVFIGFRGGKGVATSLGVVLGIFPYFTYPALIAAGVWIVLFLIWRYVSLASIFAAMAFPVAYVGLELTAGRGLFAARLPLLAFALLVPALIVYRHRANIARLRAGTEHRVARRKV